MKKDKKMIKVFASKTGPEELMEVKSTFNIRSAMARIRTKS